ncbi:MAG: lactate dehydrogenase [Bacillota bacterium]
MNVYRSDDTVVCSFVQLEHLRPLPASALDAAQRAVFLYDRDLRFSKASFALDHPGQLFGEEGLHWLDSARIAEKADPSVIPASLLALVGKGKVKAVNVRAPGYRELFAPLEGKKIRVNVLALGDVGGTLAIGLRLLGGGEIDRIGIFDVRKEACERWEQELNQIMDPDPAVQLPAVEILEADRLFDCDLFVFCASAGVPPLEAGVEDVRMYQYAANAKLIRKYAREARLARFRGWFAVVSDPVDLLCKTALDESNRDGDGREDFMGLRPEQIQGYGLGVMAARAVYHASKTMRYAHYLREGRAFGPHGKGLVIANSIERYDDELSMELTGLALNANLRIRETGFKPYIAPALSSGALSILAMLRGQWHYSANFLGGVYLGARNRTTENGLCVERTPLPDMLMQRIGDVFDQLRERYKEQNKNDAHG